MPYTWEERKEQYNRHYFVEYGGYIREDGTPSYPLDVIIERCRTLNRLFSPKSVLDCGCAHGWLIHGFNEIDSAIDARGFDVSEFAVSHSDPSIRDRLSVIDITCGLPYSDREFDVVTGFDILEHLYPYKRILDGVSEMCRVSGRWVLLRQPMTLWDGDGTEWWAWLETLNDLPHRARLALVGAVPKLSHIYPVAGGKEHPSEHPRAFWISLFAHYGYLESVMPEDIYEFPNPNAFCSYNLLVFERSGVH